MAYCDWAGESDLLRAYHDEEWGIPVHEDRKQFEYLMLEVMQCGLNFPMMLKKREIFRSCFDGFDFDRVAAYDGQDIQRIMDTPGMIRSRRKIEAVIQNARCVQRIRAEHGSFSDWLWQYTGGQTILYHAHEHGYIPAANGLSARISRDLKARGFKYLGPVTVYSHLQACGMINDHDESCPCRQRIISRWPTVPRRREQEQDVRRY